RRQRDRRFHAQPRSAAWRAEAHHASVIMRIGTPAIANRLPGGIRAGELSRPADQDVVVGPALQVVAARSTNQHVATLLSAEHIVSGITKQQVVARPAVDRIISVTASQPVPTIAPKHAVRK